MALPREQRSSVGLAYLLARLGDTLTDVGRWSTADRLKWLNDLERAVVSKRPELFCFKGLVGEVSEAEAELLLSAQELLKSYSEEEVRVHSCTDELLKTLYSGMRWDLTAFAQASADKPVWGCKDEATFDWYCFMVAGCVGRYWSQIFSLDSHLELLAVEYGKALQRINVLRDVREDWLRGRIYLPQSAFASCNGAGAPWDQLDWGSFRVSYFQRTRSMLRIGANFCDSISYGSLRLRYASILPLAIGWKTLNQLEGSCFWGNRQKVSRGEIRGIVLQSVFDVALHRKLSARYSK